MLIVLLLLLLATAAGHPFNTSKDSNDDAVYDQEEFRRSLGVCWTDDSCGKRVLVTSHGGDWDVRNPYDSMGAFQRAYDHGADAIKGDFRVSSDNIGMVIHSSPILIYESPNCYNVKVEETTASDLKKCKMEVTDYTFTSVPNLLSWADQKINVMLCVKESRDVSRAISTLIENNATSRAFLELSIGEMFNIEAQNIPGWDQIYYVVELSNSGDVSSALAASPQLLSRMFLFEINAYYEDWPGPNDLSVDIQAIHSAGIKTFTASKSNPVTSTVNNHLDMFNIGIDVAYTYNLGNAVDARIKFNSQNNITPP